MANTIIRLAKKIVQDQANHLIGWNIAQDQANHLIG